MPGEPLAHFRMLVGGICPGDCRYIRGQSSAVAAICGFGRIWCLRGLRAKIS